MDKVKKQGDVRKKPSREMVNAGVCALRPFFDGSGELWTLEFYPMAQAVIEAALEHYPHASLRSAQVSRKG